MSIILSSQTPSSPLLNNGSNFCTSIHHDLYPAIAPTNPANQLPPDYRVVITGCSKGLGRAVALAFAQVRRPRPALPTPMLMPPRPAPPRSRSPAAAAAATSSPR